MRTIRGLLALSLVFAVAFPATAMAQSAGDEQYTDPFQGQNGGGGGGNNGQSGGSSETEGGTLTDDGTSGSTTEGTAESGVAGASEFSGATGTSSAALPATGGPTTMLAAIGAAFLLSGLALRRGA